jgi:hypothetical protein
MMLALGLFVGAATSSPVPVSIDTTAVTHQLEPLFLGCHSVRQPRPATALIVFDCFPPCAAHKLLTHKIHGRTLASLIPSVISTAR